MSHDLRAMLSGDPTSGESASSSAASPRFQPHPPDAPGGGGAPLTESLRSSIRSPLRFNGEDFVEHLPEEVRAQRPHQRSRSAAGVRSVATILGHDLAARPWGVEASADYNTRVAILDRHHDQSVVGGELTRAIGTHSNGGKAMREGLMSDFDKWVYTAVPSRASRAARSTD
jgi:hypothetical protein